MRFPLTQRRSKGNAEQIKKACLYTGAATEQTFSFIIRNKSFHDLQETGDNTLVNVPLL
jgi:hypothetical protein